MWVTRQSRSISFHALLASRSSGFGVYLKATPIHTPGEQPRLAEATPTAFMDRCGYLNNQGKSEWARSAPPNSGSSNAVPLCPAVSVQRDREHDMAHGQHPKGESHPGRGETGHPPALRTGISLTVAHTRPHNTVLQPSRLIQPIALPTG